jgi:hypothetical protein
MQVGNAALVESGRELILGKSGAAGRRHRAHVHQQFDAGLLEFVKHGFGWRLLITDGEEFPGLACHINVPASDPIASRLRHRLTDCHNRRRYAANISSGIRCRRGRPVA